MNSTPNIQQALNDTAQDFRALGEAAKTDFKQLSHEAMELAQTKIIRPSAQLARNSAQRLEDQARRSAEVTKEKIDHMRGYVVENPGRALAGALAGGLVLGLLFRR
ncbi:hypothetical protein [Prosthecobacter fluviatilis]|uniref:DUF883 domain-containing protein n=1 Tax=Prosthecobacter fluviatilis TaxID=445931 RepID=A0ABW0KQ45_9BACT